MSTALHHATDPGHHRAGGSSVAAEDRSSAFTARLVAWSLGMVVLIGGSAVALVGLSTGDWLDGLVVGAFLSVFIAPAIGGLFAGVLFVDREERGARERGARRRSAPDAVPTATTPVTAGDAARAA